MIKHDPRLLMLSGVLEVSDVVKSTLGPSGRNVAIMRDSNDNLPLITDDGVRVAEFCIDTLKGEELLGAKLVYEASKRTEDEVGDGTSTTYLLASSIIENAMKILKESSSEAPVMLRRSLEYITHELIEKMSKYRVPVTDLSVLRKVANISAGRKDIGDLVSDVRDEVGVDGIISIKYSRNPKDSVKISKGYEFTGGITQEQLYNNRESGLLELEDPLVVVVDKMLITQEDATAIVRGYEAMCTNNKRPLFVTPLVVFCRGCDGDALRIITHNWFFRTDGKLLPIFPVQLPVTYSPEGQSEDISVLVGGKVIKNSAQLTPQLVNESVGLGATTIMTNKKSTTIISNMDDTELVNNIEEHIKDLQTSKSRLIGQDDSAEINDYEVRIAKMKGKAAIIYVGGSTETECTERKLKFDDSILATRSAVKDGVLPGGGVAQLLARKTLKELADEENYSIIYDKQAVSIIDRALMSIVKSLLINSGVKEELVNRLEDSSHTLEEVSINSVMDFSDAKLYTGIEQTSSDPYSVLTESLKNAVSVASQFFTTGYSVILDRRKD